MTTQVDDPQVATSRDTPPRAAGTVAPPLLRRLLPILRCPVTRQRLRPREGQLVSADGRQQYNLVGGIPDLRRAPERLHLDAAWYEPWAELDRVCYAPPPARRTTQLPHHFDEYNAAIVGERGDGRWILEIGCAQRHCEDYLAPRGFNYVGIDVEARGRGPHVLADAHNLPFADASFDLCFAKAVCEHLISPLTAIREAWRVLKPGGVFFGSTAFLEPFHDHASFFHMTHAGLLCVLRSAGFVVQRIWPGRWPYYRAIPGQLFRGTIGAPWRVAARGLCAVQEYTYLTLSNAARRAFGRPPIARDRLHLISSGALDWLAVKPD